MFGENRVVVVVDSHIQRIVLATEETTVTQQVSPRPIKCQSRLWSQRGTKVNGSHHGDNPLLRPTGIQIATKSYAALQAMAPTNLNYWKQSVCLCVCADIPFILDVRLVNAPAGVTQEEGHTGFIIPRLPSAVLALIFLAKRIQPFLSFVDREAEFSVPTKYSFSTTCWAFFSLFFSAV